MYYDGKKGVHTNVFLNEVHAKVNQKYLAMREGGDVEQAKKLQDFFQNLKMAAQNIDSIPDTTTRLLYSSLLNEIEEQINKNFKKGTKITTLFRKQRSSQSQGDVFERELTSIIQAIAYKASNGVQLPASSIHVGQQTGTTTLTDEIVEEIKQGIVQGLSEEQAFQNATAGVKYFQKRVAIKTDVQGVHVDIAAGTDVNLAEIQKLLENATFSAKSYASQSYNSQAKKIEVLNEVYPNIHLGSSNPYRAVYGALTSLNYDPRTSVSAYCAARNLTKTGTQNVINHIYHLRYVYELTGAGTRNLSGLVREARFLIYNDPSSDKIYVKSTAEILLDVFKTPPDWNGDPFGGISIKKSKFQ